jgi:uncharacterized protein (DUF952 family)
VFFSGFDVGDAVRDFPAAAKSDRERPTEDAPMSNVVYKIVSADLWQVAEDIGQFDGAGIDLNDGFIHLSTGAQVRRTAELYFRDVPNLLLVAIDAESLGEALKYEVSPDGQPFPHLYAPLSLLSVLWVKPLPLDFGGSHVFPGDVE